MATRCCPTCRVLALDDARRCAHCGGPVVLPADLARPVVSGVTALTRKPPTGWRDTLALLGTAVGVFGAAVGGAFVAGPVGLLAGPAFGVLGYSKQFWRTAFKRRERVRAIAPPRPPVGAALTGVAQPHERTLSADDVPAQPLVVAHTLGLGGDVLARRIEAVPFWLVLSDQRRILVDGSVWLASDSPEQLPAVTACEDLGVAGMPLSRAERRRITLSRTVLCAGDSVSAIGAITNEQLAGGGYRDHLVETLRGAPGTVVWLER